MSTSPFILSTPIPLLLVDDQQLCRLALMALFEERTDIQVVAEAASGMEAIRRVQSHTAEVVLMALNMPGMSGVEATKHILLRAPDTKIVILTNHLDAIYPFRILRAGARGYLSKTARPNELFNAIHAVASGESYLSHPLAPLLVNRQYKSPDEQQNTLWEGLSDRELDVLIRLVRGDGTAEIARELRFSINTINCYRHRIKKQLQVETMVELLYLAQSYQLIESSSGLGL